MKHDKILKWEKNYIWLGKKTRNWVYTQWVDLYHYLRTTEKNWDISLDNDDVMTFLVKNKNGTRKLLGKKLLNMVFKF